MTISMLDKHIRSFTTAMEKDTWCLDVSLHPPRGLHAASRRNASPDNFTYSFLEWAEQEKIVLPEPLDSKLLLQKICQQLPRVAGASFRPVDQRFFCDQGIQLANTFEEYRPPKPSPALMAEGASKLDELTERLFPCQEERRTVLQFFAHMVRYPASRPQWGLLITGAGGTGKSLLIAAAEAALGHRHSWRGNRFETPFERFSHVLPDNLLVTFDDAPLAKPDQVYERLKFAITATRVEVEAKGVQHRALREVFARVVVLSNERRPFDLTQDRRFFVPAFCQHPVDRQESLAFFANFVPFSQGSEFPSVVYHWLQDVDLEGFNPSAPSITPAHQAMCEGAAGAGPELIERYVNDRRLVHMQELMCHLKREGIFQPKESDIAKALGNCNYVSRRRPRPDGLGYMELWVPDHPRRARSLNQEEIERIRAAGVIS